MIMKYIKYSFLSAFLLLFALSCEKLERDNPLDGNHESEHDNTTSQDTNGNAFKFDSYSINFESINDYLITPGENLRIGINYSFNGSYPLSATFSISSTSSYVVCESGTAHLSGNGAYSHHPPTYPSSTSGFLVHIADNAPNGTTIPISVTIVDGTGNQTGSTFSLVVGEAW